MNAHRHHCKICHILIFLFTSLFIFFNLSVVNAEKIQPKPFQKIESVIQKLTHDGAKIGCKIIYAKNGQTLWAYQPDLPLMPASNNKLLTTAVSLIKLGPDYRFKTGVYVLNPLVDGVVQGNIYMKGFGDPFLVNEEMWMLTHELALRGLKRVTGDIIADDSFFDQIRNPEGWNEDRPPYWYNAEISALSFNFNTVAVHIQPDISPGRKAVVRLDPELPCLELVNEAMTAGKGQKNWTSVQRIYSEGENLIKVNGQISMDSPIKRVYRAIKDPTIYTAMAFGSFLKQEGISFQGKIIKGSTPEDTIPFYIHESKPLSRIIADLNKISNNFIAEQMLKTLGAEMEDPPGTHEKGIKIIKETLTQKGISLDGLELYDGSGLSPLNRISARIFCDVLFYMANSEGCSPEYVSSLPISGLDGTLKDRPLNGQIKGTIRAKTGRIRGVSALSGYLWTIKGEPFIFSILMNGKQSQIEDFMNSQDRILSILSTIDNDIEDFGTYLTYSTEHFQ